MMKTKRFASCAGALALLGGCTTSLGVERAPMGASASGIPAVLPFTRFEITVTWRLASCGTDPKVVLGVEAIPGSEDDPTQTYLIDSNSLQGPLNTSQLNVTYHDNSGTLKSVNAEVEDRSAAVIANIVRTAVALAPMVLGVPPVATLGLRTPASGSRIGEACNAAMVTALRNVAALETQLETTNDQVAKQTERVAVLAAAAVRMNGAIDPGTSQRYGDAIDNLERLIAAQAGLAAQLAEALKPLTYRRVVRWPDNGRELIRPEPVVIDRAVLSRWFTEASTSDQWPRAFFAIESVVGPQPAAGGNNAMPGTRVAGIPYRMLVRGRLVTCPSLCRREGEGRTVVEGPVAQLGGVNVLPVRNPPFGSTAFSAEFRRDGTLVSAGYEQRTAPLEQVSGAIAGAAEAMGPLLDPTARLNAETAYLQALQERRAAAEAISGVPADATAEAREALEAETTLLNAQISNLQARLTLQELQARSPRP